MSVEKILTCGYNGLMLPVMEDITLAARAAAVTSIPPVSSPSSSSSSDPSAGEEIFLISGIVVMCFGKFCCVCMR